MRKTFDSAHDLRVVGGLHASSARPLPTRPATRFAAGPRRFREWREGNVLFVNDRILPTLTIRSGEVQRWARGIRL
jgi:hypothetical protein